METRRLPIGISDYKKMIDEGYYYVDKTDFIRQIIEEGALITLLPRPRRFGKTLNLSMLRYFFEKTDGNVFRPLFDGKRIREWKGFDRHQGQYPVIMLTLKDCKADTFEDTLVRIGYELKTSLLAMLTCSILLRCGLITWMTLWHFMRARLPGDN